MPIEYIAISILVVIIAFQWVYIIVKDHSFNKERKDLLNRIMSKDPVEYKRLSSEDKPKETKSINAIKRYKDAEIEAYLKATNGM
ncbi:MAG: hypothetical protein PWP27_207 [Clostridiales bacterium]|jgi:hypothetical protein|nr:hypothetical protein [Clostridiales bacterium]